MKILIVSSKFSYGKGNYGGVNKMLLWLGNTLAEDPYYSITFCTIYDKERSERISPIAKSVELNVQYHQSFVKRNLHFFTCAATRIKKVLKNGNYDYVVSFDGMAFYPLLYYRKRFKYTFVVSERADPNYDHSFFSSLKRKLYKNVGVLVCQTDGAKNCFSDKIQLKTIVIPNPVSIPETKWNRAYTRHSIACVGRLHVWQKRQDTLIKAFKSFSKTYPDYILNLYGSGPDEKKLKLMVKVNGIEDKVIFHGETNNVQEKLLNDEIFTLTSDFEGIPNALLEAMALGMPVISTKCSPGGAELLINDHKNGLLVDCNDVYSLSKALCEMVADKEKAELYGVAARESVRRFSPDIIIKKWKEVFR